MKKLKTVDADTLLYRTDLTSNQVGTKLQTDEIVAKGFGVSKTTVPQGPG